MGKKLTKQANIPTELEGVATTKDFNTLEDKLNKCYSADRYEDFQEAVKKIAIDVIGSEDGRIKIKSHAKESVKEYKEENGWKKLTFWLPTAVSVLVLIVAIIAIYYRPIG